MNLPRPSRAAWLLILGLFPAASLWAQATNTAALLLQPLNNARGSARTAGMGSAFVAVADDSSSLFLNPAGLGGLSRSELAIHHDSWLVDMAQESLVGSLPLGDDGGAGAMVSYMGYGSLENRDGTGALVGSYSPDKMGASLGYGKVLTPGFSAGLAINGDRQEAMGHSYEIWSGTAGILLDTESNWRFGATLSNFGWNQAGNSLATALQAGFSWSKSLGPDHHILLAFCGTTEFQGINRIETGVEYSFESRYFLRTGVQWLQQNTQIEGLQAWTAGGGLCWQDFQLDYAFLPYGDLGASHRFSLSYLLPESKTTKVIPPPPSSRPAFKPEPNKGAPETKLRLEFDLPADNVAQAQALENQGKFNEAMPLYEAALVENPQDVTAWWALGSDHFKKKERAECIRCFKQVLKFSPDNKTLSDWLERYKKADR